MTGIEEPLGPDFLKHEMYNVLHQKAKKVRRSDMPWRPSQRAVQACFYECGWFSGEDPYPGGGDARTPAPKAPKSYVPIFPNH
jgi:hypothetical protein